MFVCLTFSQVWPSLWVIQVFQLVTSWSQQCKLFKTTLVKEVCSESKWRLCYKYERSWKKRKCHVGLHDKARRETEALFLWAWCWGGFYLVFISILLTGLRGPAPVWTLASFTSSVCTVRLFVICAEQHVYLWTLAQFVNTDRVSTGVS